MRQTVYQTLVVCALCFANTSYAQNMMVPPPPVGGGGISGAGGAVQPDEACMLIGGSGNPGCPMEDPGVTLPSISGAALEISTPASLGIPVLTLDAGVADALFVDASGLYLEGAAGSQLNQLIPAGTHFVHLISRSLPAYQFLMTVFPSEDGWGLFGSSAITDPGTIEQVRSVVDTDEGTIHAGAQLVRNPASLVPLFCGSVDMDGAGNYAVPLTCIMPDGTIDLGLNSAGTSATVGKTGVDKSSGSTETWALGNSGAGVLNLTVDGSVVIGAANFLTLSNATGTDPTYSANSSGNVTHSFTNPAGSGGTVVEVENQVVALGGGGTGSPTNTATSPNFMIATGEGMYSDAANRLSLSANSVEAFRASAAGVSLYDGAGAVAWACEGGATACAVTGGYDIIPTTNGTSDLGTVALRWNAGFFADGASNVAAVSVGQTDAGLHYNGGLILQDDSGPVAIVANGAGNDIVMDTSDDLTVTVNSAFVFGISQSGDVGFTGVLGGGALSNAPAIADATSGYNMMATTGSDPAAGDCNAANEAGRYRWQDTAQELWICDGADGWRVIASAAP